MRILFLIVLFCTIANSKLPAQGGFAPLGAKWTFTYINPGAGLVRERPFILEVVAMEKYEGRLCSKIEFMNKASWLYSPWFVYEENDSVFYWSTYSDSFELLYDFNANPGDTWVVGGIQILQMSEDCQDSLIVMVDSVSYLVLNGDSLRVQHISWDSEMNYCLEWGATIIDGIGNPDFLIPNYGFFETVVANLRCYDTDSVHYQFVPFPCDTIVYMTLDAEDINEGLNAISITPNPVSHTLNFSSNVACTELTVLIYSLQGELLLQSRQNIPGQVDVSSLPGGAFICQVQKDTRRSRGMLFVK